MDFKNGVSFSFFLSARTTPIQPHSVLPIPYQAFNGVHLLLIFTPPNTRFGCCLLASANEVVRGRPLMMKMVCCCCCCYCCSPAAPNGAQLFFFFLPGCLPRSPTLVCCPRSASIPISLPSSLLLLVRHSRQHPTFQKPHASLSS